MDLNQIKPTDWRKKLETEYIHGGNTLLWNLKQS